jgi:hypothetical protein
MCWKLRVDNAVAISIAGHEYVEWKKKMEKEQRSTVMEIPHAARE